jgi:hypothetical protein
VIYNFDRIERDYRECCRLTGRRPRRLIRPAWYPPRPIRPAECAVRLGSGIAGCAASTLPPDVFTAVVDALATALVADVRRDGGQDR